MVNPGIWLKQLGTNWLTLHLDLPSCLFPSGLATKTFYSFLSSPTYVKCSSHLIRLDLICLISLGDEYKLWSFSSCNFLNSTVISCVLGPNILLRTLFSNTLSVYALPLVWDTKFHTHTKQLQNYDFVYFKRHIPRQQVGWQNNWGHNEKPQSGEQVQLLINWLTHWLIMSMGWEYVSEPRPSTGVLFIPQVTYEHEEPWWDDDAGWGKLLTRPLELSGNPTSRVIWE
jgi:hypothetical protein